MTTQPECAWNASSPSAWISGLTPASGQGSGRIEFSAALNSSAVVREGEIVVNEGRLRVTQQAAPCAFTLTPATQVIAAVGGTGSITISTLAGCAWSALSDAPWLTLTGSTTGTASGTMIFTVAANTGTERSATIAVGDQQAIVRQSGSQGPASCEYSISPSEQLFAAAGGTGTPITVTAAVGCAWTALPSDPWIVVSSGASGSGVGSVTFGVAANAATVARTGTLTIAGQVFTVQQAGVTAPPVCSIAIAPASQSVGAAAGTGTTISVTAGPTCAWTATSDSGWLTVLSGASGTGNGTVTFGIAANTTGVTRTGSLRIGGQTFRVEQAAAPCSFTANPARVDLPATGQTGASFEVQTLPGCVWSASSDAAWITVTAGASGSGSGFVSFNVSANSGAVRSATLTVVGPSVTTPVTVTVNQSAPACTFSLAPTGSNPPSAAAPNQSVDVTTNLGTCSWTATSGVPWLTVTGGGSGTGSGQVRYNVQQNAGPARSGTLTIAGQPFTVNQAGCAYVLQPTSQHHPLAGATLRYVTVTNPAGCTWPWTSTSHVSWIRIDPPGSGTGQGFITYTIGATTAPRSGTLTVAGETFTALQP